MSSNTGPTKDDDAQYDRLRICMGSDFIASHMVLRTNAAPGREKLVLCKAIIMRVDVLWLSVKWHVVMCRMY